MSLRLHRLRNLSSGLALLASVTSAAVGCGGSTPIDEGGPGPSQDASLDRADAGAIDASSVDQASDGGSLADATADAGDEDRSSQDRLSDDRSTEAGASSDADGGTTDRSDAGDASDSDAGADGAVDVVDASARDGDGGDDAIDASDAGPDVNCDCTPNDSGTMGIMSLECFCRNGGCLSYDVALSQCPYTPFPEDHRLDTYADCNLVIITVANSIGIGGNTYVYDATTHEFVGGSASGDYQGQLCGTTKVFGYMAGTYPPPTCPRTQSVPRCVDGGDGG